MRVVRVQGYPGPIGSGDWLVLSEQEHEFLHAKEHPHEHRTHTSKPQEAKP